ncbi:serine protease snake-like [Sabethes cyaneus]|uniref:serine protease snake-like n=1 Tax=Sabethes cyaneus TaxID=53552 RepID=UPI00237DD171|nr:serine protease snake-like [Sabethes cyaneus]
MKLWILSVVLTIIQNGLCQSTNNAINSHVIQIGITQSDGTVNFFCGGSYIGEKSVVFGAHCTNKHGRLPDVVQFGKTLQRTFNVPIENVTVHYRYKPQFDYHNMAVAQLKQNPQLVSREAIKPACILKWHPKSNTEVQLIGTINEQFEQTNLLAVGSDKCHEYYNPNRKLRFGVLLCCFCAKNSYTDRCTDQHSSPLQIIQRRSGKNIPYLVGHKSVGKSCGTGVPAIYTRYGSYYEWLETVTGIKYNKNACTSRY